MSNKIFGFCEAGCRYPVISEEDLSIDDKGVLHFRDNIVPYEKLLGEDINVNSGATKTFTLDVSTGGIYEINVSCDFGGYDDTFVLRSGESCIRPITVVLEGNVVQHICVSASISGTTLSVKFIRYSNENGTYTSYNSGGTIKRIYRIYK